MKNKILTLIIGILIGAIIATAGFLIYTKVNGKSNTNNGQMMMKERGSKSGMFPEMQNGESSVNTNQKQNKQKANALNNTKSSNTENSEMPTVPNGEAPNGNPPAMPSNNNNNALQSSSL